mgnify:CR=1 FL=1
MRPSFFTHSFAKTGIARQLPDRSEKRVRVFWRNKYAALPVDHDLPGGIRTNLRQAMKLLTEAGWKLEDGVLRKEGVKLSFEIILVSPTFERVMAAFTDNLKKIGIEASYRTIDPALYTWKGYRNWTEQVKRDWTDGDDSD